VYQVEIHFFFALKADNQMQYDKIFRKKEIQRTENFYLFSERKKIVVFVPREHLNLLLKKMSLSGAGIIGNYTECSFRVEGTGTFRPDKKAKPYSGKINKLSEETEFRFEMECSTNDLNGILDSLIRFHPYEEPAYEVYDFIKRNKTSCGLIVILKKEIKAGELIKRLSKKKLDDAMLADRTIKRPALISKDINRDVIMSAKNSGCDCLIKNRRNNFTIHIIK